METLVILESCMANDTNSVAHFNKAAVADYSISNCHAFRNLSALNGFHIIANIAILHGRRMSSSPWTIQVGLDRFARYIRQLFGCFRVVRRVIHVVSSLAWKRIIITITFIIVGKLKADSVGDVNRCQSHFGCSQYRSGNGELFGHIFPIEEISRLNELVEKYVVFNREIIVLPRNEFQVNVCIWDGHVVCRDIITQALDRVHITLGGSFIALILRDDILVGGNVRESS